MCCLCVFAVYLVTTGDRARAVEALTPHRLYLPIILKNYTSPPPATLSRYLGYNNNLKHNLTWDKLRSLGCSQGSAAREGFNGVVILNFGEPWKENNLYGTKLYDQPYYTFVDTSTISHLAKGYLQGFWDCSPANTHLSLGIGTTNYGPHVDDIHGEQWANMVNGVQTWINNPPSYASKLSAFFGAIDSELDWNGRVASLNWATGYGRFGTQDYYYGNCAGCPTEEYYWYDPNGDWTLEDVYLMADGKYHAVPLPQIYSTNGINADQWDYASWYSLINHEYPLAFAGTLTQWDACQDRQDKCDPGTDNTPTAGWMQLFILIKQELNWSTDISWKN